MTNNKMTLKKFYKLCPVERYIVSQRVLLSARPHVLAGHSLPVSIRRTYLECDHTVPLVAAIFRASDLMDIYDRTHKITRHLKRVVIDNTNYFSA